MTQEERWMSKWQTAIEFVRTHGRNPSKFDGEEREIRNWVKHQRKLLNAGELKEERVEKFRELLALMDENKHKSQYQ